MLRNLLSPIRSRFDASPRSTNTLQAPGSPWSPRSSNGRLSGEDDDGALEDFARDVMVELMRNAVEALKTAEDVKTRTEALSEVQRIIAQDPRTKDVFREMDGFLVLMSVLSTVQEQPKSSSPSRGSTSSPALVLVDGQEEQENGLADVVESTRLAFVILSDAVYKHPQNAEWFRTRVGYEFLSHATLSLISDPETATGTLGLLLSLSLHDFSFSSFFTQLRTNYRSCDQNESDPASQTITQYEDRLQQSTICVPGALLILWNAVASLSTDDASCMRTAMFKVFDMLSYVSHRNHALLCGLDLVGPVFKRFHEDPQISTGKDEKQILQKLLKRLLEMGAETKDVRRMFEKALDMDGATDTIGGGNLDMEMLDLLKVGMRSRWTEHFSLEGSSALVLQGEGMKGLPSSGFTFMMWIRLSSLPKQGPFTLFSVRLDSSILVELKVNEDGTLAVSTMVNTTPAHFSQSKIIKARWTHITLVHYPHRSSSPTIRLFIDGTLYDSLQSAYPKPGLVAGLGQYILGDDSDSAQLSWCISSAHMLSVPLADEFSRLIYHLSPRYSGTFQDPNLIRFLTYEASTSLNMFLANLAASTRLGPDARSSFKSKTSGLALVEALKDGLGIPENQYIFALSARHMATLQRSRDQAQARSTGMPSEVFLQSVATMIPSQCDAEHEGRFRVNGDAVLVRTTCLDHGLWKIGGPVAALRLVQAASTPHELSRALGVLLDGLRNNWQNSEDMERLHGYDILVGILRTKSALINLTSFETVFEFLGLNFRSPEHSTVTNVVAYHSIALDFEFWSHTRKEIQQAHLEHFAMLLVNSRYKKFNVKQRLAKLGLVRQLLFALQTDWYHKDVIPSIVNALSSVCQADFSRDEVIKPMVSYLAANLHGDALNAESPSSTLTRIDLKDTPGKAEQLLVSFMRLLSTPKYHSRFTAVLPLTRICLLLLGERPTSLVAEQVLNLIGMSIKLSTSFIRKFELVSGWSVLKTVVPGCWDAKVHKAAFAILTGHPTRSEDPEPGHDEHWCTSIVPTILSSLKTGLVPVAERSQLTYDANDDQGTWSPELTMEALIEELMSLHTTNAAFRQVFASQQTTQIFVHTYKTFVSAISNVPVVNNKLTIRLLEKLSHFGLALALDNAVVGAYKREILNTLETAEMVTNPDANRPTGDRNLDTLTVRQRAVSTRLSSQVGERTVIKTMARMAEWRRTVRESEKKRLRKDMQDLREFRRQVPRLQEWTMALTCERGLWPQKQNRTWRLDETEGPHRIRKKLEPANTLVSPSTRVDMKDVDTRHIQTPEDGNRTPDQVAEVPPWAETYEISATDIEERQLSEEIVEDKHRRVRHELEPGDIIDAVQTVARIVGVDSSPGLLILGKTHIYMLDGLVENDEGEVIDAHDAQKRLFFVPGSILELDGPQRAQRWSHAQIAGFGDKRFLFRDVALEIYFKDSRSLLIVFLDKKRRAGFDNRLAAVVARNSPEQLVNPSILKSPLLGKMGQIVLSGLKSDELGAAQRRWQAREISNFTYLSILNQIAGRTPSDATQYPIFPWVLQDYTSETLDLTALETYRDLAKPMGALTTERQNAAELRYNSLKSVNEEPFHYGTHFSSSMIVCHFLIRLAPFTHMFRTLQGGDWDLPDRLFSDLARAYRSAATDVRGDVRELIPEFFTCPEFLENAANLDFGVLSSTGERIHDVKLPPWARDDPLLFVTLNRRALESPIVSENLSQWIDLVWGYKQRDPESFNVFHPLSYEGSIDLDSIQDDLQREATVGIIHNFGQTPRKLFTAPHPQRYNHGLSTLPIGTLHGIEEDPHLLSQPTRCFKDLGINVPIHDFVLDAFGDKMIPCPPTTLYMPLYTHEHIEWSKGTSELRLFVDNKLIQVIENSFCTCASFADPNILATGSSDYTVRMWKMTREQQHQHSRVHLTHIMRMHTDEVICVTACRTWSLVISGSRDGSAALWDLNKGVYIRSIWHGEASDENAVRLVAINESTGYIASCSDTKLCLHTINARHITTLDLVSPPVYATVTAPITSLAFHERDYSHLGILAAGASDGSITLRTWTADGTPEGEKAQWEFVTVRTMKVRNGRGAIKPPAVTALKFLAESLVHGEETGKSFVWSLPQ